MKAGYRRRDLIERHTWATRLPVSPDVAEAAALAICDRAASPDEAREFCWLIGVLSPDGPAKALGRARVSTRAPSLNESW